MASESKLRKTSKRRHWGRGGRFLKNTEPGIKGLDFYNASERKKLNKKENFDID